MKKTARSAKTPPKGYVASVSPGREMLFAILDAMKDGIIIVNRDHDLEYVNPALVEQFGPVEGKKCHQYLHGRDGPCPECKNEAVFGGQTVRWEWQLGKDGRIYDVLDTPLRNADGSISKLEVFRDVTERKRIEEEAQAAAKKYTSIIHTALDGFWITDLKGRFLEVNDSYCCMTGYSREELLNMSVSDVEAAETAEETARHINKVMRKESDLFETRHRRKDGSIIDAQVSANFIPQDGGCFVVFIRDITDRKRAEKALTREKDLLETIMENTDTHLAYLDYDFNFVRVNSMYARGSGHSREELIGKNHFALFPNEENERIFRQVRDTGEPVTYRDKPFEFADQPWRGVTYWDWSLTPVKDASGNVQGLVLSLVDTTGRRRMELALEESEANYRTLVESSPDGVISLEPDGRIIDANEALCGLLDCTREEIQGGYIEKLIPQLSRQQLHSYKDQLIKHGQFEGEFEGVAGEGRVVPLWVKAVGLFDFRRDLGRIIIYARDIAERKKLDQLKDEFTSMVSHELRTPLTVIMGSLNTAFTEWERLRPGEIRQLIHDASLEAEALAHLLGNLLELSRAQAERLYLHHESVDMGAVVRRTVDKIKPQATQHRFIIDLPETLPLIKADPLRLERILYNLLENAAKYSPPGREIKVFARKKEDFLITGVADQGSGIPHYQQAKLFAPFQRLEEEKSRRERGVGLGLMVCRRLVEAHGGRIWVESEPGTGSTFFFSLPLSKT